MGCWKKYKQSNEKNAIDDLKPSPTLSKILRKATFDRGRSYESMGSLRSTPTEINGEMNNFKPDYTPTNTTTAYFVAKYPFTEKEKSQIQSLSPPRPILSLQGTEYNPKLANSSKFSSPASNCLKHEKIEDEFSQEGKIDQIYEHVENFCEKDKFSTENKSTQTNISE